MEQAEIIIDDEFKKQIPDLADDEYRLLEKSIQEEGCREPLAIWSGNNILLDGHHRYKICQEHGIDFDIREIELADRETAQDWIDANQLGRRNLSPDQFRLILGRLYNRKKKSEKFEVGNTANPTGKNQHNDIRTEDHFDPPSSKSTTAKNLADQHGVGEATVKRAGEFAETVDQVKEKEPEIVAKGEKEVLKKAKELNKKKKEEKKQQLEQAKEQIEEEKQDNFNPPLVVNADYKEWLENQKPCDLLLTDPPYSTDVEDVEAFAKEWLPLALSKVKSTGRAFVFVGAYPEELQAYLKAANPNQILVWTYRNTLGPSPKKDYKLNWQAILYFRMDDASELDCPIMTEQFSVQDISAPDGRHGTRYHEWQKPDELAERLIRHSTKTGDLVLDPFCCTGAFPLAANRLGREGRGCDISIDNLKIAEERGCMMQTA
jgi:ParB-like chromosome segregation protein Spo0J